MFFACVIWCVADVSSVSSSSELTRRANARNVGYTPNHTGEKHTISSFVDQSRIQFTRQFRKTAFFKTSLSVFVRKFLSDMLNTFCVMRV